MKRLFLHIGLPKTGSSALQVFLAKNRDALLTQSIDYLAIGEFEQGKSAKITSGNAGHLARTLVPPGSPLALTNPEHFERQFYAALETSPAETVVLSSELFSGIARGALDGLISVVRKRGFEVHVAYYIRRQDQFLASSYVQQVKRHGMKLLPDDFVAAVHKHFDYLLYDTYDRGLREQFGTGRVHCLDYEDAIKAPDGLFSSFVGALGGTLEGLDCTVPAINTSLSAKDVAIFLRVNRFEPRMQFSDTVVENSIALGESRAGVEHRFFSDARLSELDAYYRDENARLAKRIFGRNELFARPRMTEPYQPIESIEITIDDVLTLFGGLLVSYDKRLAALEQAVNGLKAAVYRS